MPEVEINDITGQATVGVTQTVAQVAVSDSGTAPIVQVTTSPSSSIVQVGIIGPQGPGTSTLAAMSDVDVTAKVDKSVLVFNQATNKFVANDVNTMTTLTDGGNF